MSPKIASVFLRIIGEVLTYSIDPPNMHIGRPTCCGYLTVKRHGGVKGNTKYFNLTTHRYTVVADL